MNDSGERFSVGRMIAGGIIGLIGMALLRSATTAGLIGAIFLIVIGVLCLVWSFVLRAFGPKT